MAGRMADPFERRGDVAWITLDRPKVRNAIDIETIRRLRAAADAAARDETVRAVVLTGAGDTFCSGGDIHEMVARRGQGVATFERHLEGFAGLVRSVTESPKVWVARVNGDAVGAGFGLVLMCDLAVAAESARFAALFGRVGLVADSGVTALLPRAVGLRRAQEMLLTARFVDAATAADWGLVTRAVAADALDGSVQEVLAALGQIPLPTLARLKRQVLRNAQVPLSDGFFHEAILQGFSFSTPEHAERVDAFLAQRKKGRSE